MELGPIPLPGDQTAHHTLELLGLHDAAAGACVPRPPRWFPAPSSVAGARMNSFTPKLTISSSTKLSQQSTRMRPCCAAMSAVAAKKQA